METKLTNLFIILYITTVSVAFSQSNTSNNQIKEIYSEGQILSMLNKFYTTYIAEKTKIDYSENTRQISDKIDSIRRKYCTIKLFNKIAKDELNAELDADPFLKSQDFNIEWSKTLKIRKDSKKQNLYIVSYSYYDNYKHTNNQTTIKLTVVRQKGCYRIDSVW